MNNLRMKMTFPLMTILFLVSITVIALPVSAKPATFTVPYYQAQFQWRAWKGPFGDWYYDYQNYETEAEFRLTGKVIHASWSYKPYVTDEEGASTVYVYDKESGLWIEHEGRVSYKYSKYGDYTAYNFFRGYLQFDGDPSATSFQHGVAYQWIYIYAPEDDTGVTDILTYAHWDEVMGAWLVGFSIYIWDVGPQSYTIPTFPDPFIEPVPASNYNPLDL